MHAVPPLHAGAGLTPPFLQYLSFFIFIFLLFIIFRIFFYFSSQKGGPMGIFFNSIEKNGFNIFSRHRYLYVNITKFPGACQDLSPVANFLFSV